MDNSEKPVKEKRRNSEKRKEKSRDAARCRRSRETAIFSDMAKGLPLPPSVITQLDKASVMRLVISYLKIQNLVSMIPEKITQDKLHDSLFLKALEGFIVIISAEGDLVYLSENVNEYLGITQVDLMGNSIYEFSHPCDHEEIRDVLSIKSHQELFRSFFVRLKCTLTSKGRNVNLKSATYKVIHCSGRVFLKQPMKSEQERKALSDGTNNQHYLVAIGEPIPHPANIEIPLDKQTFLSKHSLDMKFTYADEKMIEFLGYNPEDLIGKTLFDFYHAMDSEAIDRGFKTLFSKGQCETGKYRFLAKGGGYVWVLTQATMIYGNKGQKPNSIVCVNFVISGIENKNEIYSCTQLLGKKGVEEEKEEEYRVKAEPPQTNVPKFVTAKIFASSVKKDAAPVTRPTAVTSKIFARLPKQEKSGNALPVKVSTAPTNSLFPVSPNTLSPVPESEKPRTLRPQLATSKIFAPRTEDMNKGFLTFSDDEPGLTMLKDEPEDLTHLAPTAGDVCVPLDLPQITDMFDDFLSENYCPLLTNELSSLSDSQSSKASGDPFISYRDETESAGSPTDLNSRLRSPPLTKSPGGCSIPSLCSPERSPILTDEDHMTNFMSLNIDSGGSEMDEDLCLKAPFIPLDEDLPLLISATDLMWSSPPEKINTPSKDYTDTWPPPIKPESSLAELLLNDSFSPPASSNRKLRPVVHLSEALNISSSKKNDRSWQVTTPDEPVRAKMSSSLPRSEKLLHNHRRSPPGVGPPAGERKRAHSGLPDTDQSTKRTKKPEKMPSQLLQHLISSPRPKGRDEGVWIADGGGGSESPPKIQSHSVLMNLLEKIPKENLPAVASILRQLSTTSNARAKEDGEERQRKLRTNSCSLLTPEGPAIPSLIDLSQQDYDVNAPVALDSSLLQGQDLLNALDITDGMAVSL